MTRLTAHSSSNIGLKFSRAAQKEAAMKCKASLQILILALCCWPLRSAAETSLSLQDYLQQVSEKHDGIHAAQTTAENARLESKESGLLVKPNLIGGASSTIGGQNNPISVDPVQFRSRFYTLGLSETTPIGLTGKLTYNRSELILPGFSPSHFDSSWGQFDLSVSLWRNAFGSEIRAQVDALESGALAKGFSQSYVSKSLLQEAESSYWRLQLARELILIQKDAVDRAKRLTEWASRRSRLQLTDRAEYLQTSTAYQTRKLDLQVADDNERAAARAFNSSIGIDSNFVEERLSDISVDLTANMKTPPRTGLRDDVKAAELQAKASIATAKISRERNKPTFEAYATLLTNQPDSPGGQLAGILATTQPSTVVGLRLVAPLDFVDSYRVRQGYNAEASANESLYRRKVFEENRDWSDLTIKFSQAQARLKMYAELEKEQREKLLFERDRQQRGRSTLEQVLIYEGDYEQAQMGRINTLTELLNLNAQMKLYGASNESR
jgi:outer membrane protein TolC